MEDRASQPNELEGYATTITESQPQAPSDDDDQGEFEFPFVSRDSPAGTAAPADELFADGRIRPFYPAFGHGGVFIGRGGTAPAEPAPRVRGQLGRLFLEESRARNSSISSTASTASSTDDDGGGGLEGAPPESYCLWTPGLSSSSSSLQPRPPRKSSSTGSMARWRRISDLVVGRSHSDGKDKFMFFPAPQPNKEAVNKKPHEKPKAKAKPSPAASGVRKQAPAEVHTAAAAHRIAYGGIPGDTPRRTFLPYREELVGFFANVNGIGRSQHHPF